MNILEQQVKHIEQVDGNNNMIIYNTEFLCSYVFYDETLVHKNPLSLRYISNIDNENTTLDLEYDKEVAEYLYKNELLYALKLHDYHEEVVTDKIKKLYQIVFIDTFIFQDDRHSLTVACKKLAAILLTDNLEMGFMLLFSYNLYHITHICLCDLIATGTIIPENSKSLEEMVNDVTSKK